MKDWGEVSEQYELIFNEALNKELNNESEAQTRFDIIDRIIKDILQWGHGQISVEEHSTGSKFGYIDYLLHAGDWKIIIEAKKVGASFPTLTKKKKLKVTGTILGQGEIKKALDQAEDYAINKKADVVMVTNGNCWCFYPMNFDNKENLYATLLFPFDDTNDAETLFNFFEVHNVENNSLTDLKGDKDFILNNKILNVIDNADYRVGRNNIADHIMKGIDYALLSEALLNDETVLKECYVESEGRTKFDSTLKIHLTQFKPRLIEPAKKIKRDKKNDEIISQISNPSKSITSPVTLIIGSVGSGKTTYLKHFELIKSKQLLQENKTHWIYIDYEKMGMSGNPRTFLYNSLNEYLLEDHPHNPTDFQSVIMPAYKKELEALRRGPFALISNDEKKFEAKISEIIEKDFNDVEPYVEKILRYIALNQMCIIVLDNVDLYEDENLETNVFSEAISLSKKLNCNIFISIRDSTFIKHKNNSIFNAHELKKFWINPPSFKDVLSKRLNYASRLLLDEEASIELNNGSILRISDLGTFFKIVQRSVLSEYNSDLLEYLSDRNTRKGITLIQNFLTSGHVNADKAIIDYVEGSSSFSFPFHELFKGSVLGQWKYYKEERSEIINLFDSGLGSEKQQLVLLFFLKYLQLNARVDKSEIPLEDILEFFSSFGITDDTTMILVDKLCANSIISTNEKHLDNSKYFITLCGGYYISNLVYLFVYTETILMDTNIFDVEMYGKLCEITYLIEDSRDLLSKMKLRYERMLIFFTYLEKIEKDISTEIELSELNVMTSIKDKVLKEIEITIDRMAKRKNFINR